jgi:hypothetical protein
MKSQVFGAMLLGVALLAGPAHAGLVTINFDGPGFTNFVAVTNQFTDVTFSSSGGDIVMISAQAAANPLVPPYLSSAPNLICTGTPAALPSTSAAFDCTHDLILTFATPVDNLSFTAYGNQTVAPGAFAQADIFFAEGPAILNMPLTVSHTVHCGDPTKDCLGDPQSLAFTGITQVIIHNNIDTAGTAYDDFSFTYAGGVDAPEPSTLVLTGLCGIFWTGRRFLARKSRKNA